MTMSSLKTGLEDYSMLYPNAHQCQAQGVYFVNQSVQAIKEETWPLPSGSLPVLVDRGMQTEP